jgi:hypothetical protein
LLNEAHLHIELVELTRRTVSTWILITETWSDLEIPIESRNHQELLELLRSLRQREELSWMESRWDEEIARALWGAARENRSLKLGKAHSVHQLTNSLNNRGAKEDVFMNLLASEIEEAVGKACWLWRLIVLADLKRKNLRSGKHLQAITVELDLSRWDLRIDHTRFALNDLARHLNNRLYANVLNGRTASFIKDHLGLSVIVSKIDENNSSVIAFAKDPTRESNCLPGVRSSKLVAGVGTIDALKIRGSGHEKPRKVAHHSAKAMEDTIGNWIRHLRDSGDSSEKTLKD